VWQGMGILHVSFRVSWCAFVRRNWINVTHGSCCNVFWVPQGGFVSPMLLRYPRAWSDKVLTLEEIAYYF